MPLYPKFFVIQNVYKQHLNNTKSTQHIVAVDVKHLNFFTKKDIDSEELAE